MVELGHTATTQPAVQLRRARPEVSLKAAFYQQDGQPADSGRSVRVRLNTGHIADVSESALRYKDGLREDQITTDQETLVYEDDNNKGLGWLAKPDVAQEDFRLQVPAFASRIMDFHVLDSQKAEIMTTTRNRNCAQ